MKTPTLEQPFKKAKHIIWIVIDSMRSYKTGIDDRDEIDYMAKLAKESIVYSNTITSAPSSIMSLSAMMSSIPAYYIGLNYLDFKYDPEIFPSIPYVWRNAGHEFVSFLNSLETREVFNDLLRPVSKRYYPKGLSDLKKNWSNQEVNEVLKNFLDSNVISKPTFFFIWYNIRLDPTTSNQVARGIEMFKSKGLWDESFRIVTSDHGYLDPKRGYSPERLKELGLTHDILVTEDQIKIPLYMIYPGGSAGLVKTMTSSLDIMPTLLDYFELEYPTDSSLFPFGRSLLNQSDNCDKEADKLIRVDGRFMFQPGRITAIRGEKYKYVYYHDENKEQFFDISTDFFEENDLVGRLNKLGFREVFSKFQEYFRVSEESVREFVLNVCFNKFKNKVKSKFDLNKIATIALVRVCEHRSFQHFHQVCGRIFPEKKILCLELNDCMNSSQKIDLKIAIFDHTFKDKNKEAIRCFKMLKSKYKIALDVNVETIGAKQKVSPLIFIKMIKNETHKLISNPILFFGYLKKLKKLMMCFCNMIDSAFVKDK